MVDSLMTSNWKIWLVGDFTSPTADHRCMAIAAAKETTLTPFGYSMVTPCLQVFGDIRDIRTKCSGITMVTSRALR